MTVHVQCQDTPEKWLLEFTDDEMADFVYAVNLVPPGTVRGRTVKRLQGEVFGASRELRSSAPSLRQWDRLVALGEKRADA